MCRRRRILRHAEDFGNTVTAINLRPISKDRSQVELDGVGFLNEPAFDSLLKKFKLWGFVDSGAPETRRGARTN